MNGKTFQRPFEFWWKEFQFEINEVIHLQTLRYMKAIHAIKKCHFYYINLCRIKFILLKINLPSYHFV